MTTKINYERFETGDFSPTPRVFQGATPDENTILQTCRAEIVFNNNPTHTLIRMKIFSKKTSTSLGKLIATSTNTHTRASLALAAGVTDHPNAFYEAFFTFSDILLRASTEYFFAIDITGYTGTGSSHIGWSKSFPRPFYETGLTLTYVKAGVNPLHIYFKGQLL